MTIERFNQLLEQSSRWHPGPSWPQKLDHNGRRRFFHKLSWDKWEVVTRTGRLVKELLEEALVEWKQVRRIEDRMVDLGVRSIIVENHKENGGGYVTRIGDSPYFEIRLWHLDSTLEWIATLGHELGHMEAHRLGSTRLDRDVPSHLKGKGLGDPEIRRFLTQSYLEEAFCDRFGDAWFSIEPHRSQAVQLFRKIQK